MLTDNVRKARKKNPLKNRLLFVCSTQIHQVLGYIVLSELTLFRKLEGVGMEHIQC